MVEPESRLISQNVAGIVTGNTMYSGAKMVHPHYSFVHHCKLKTHELLETHLKCPEPTSDIRTCGYLSPIRAYS